MAVKPIPDGYHTINPYMGVRDAQALVTFLKNAFDTHIELLQAPNETILNGEAQVGDSKMLIDQVPKESPNNRLIPMMLYVYVEDVDASYRKAIAAGAESIEEPADQIYGDRRAAVRDPANNQWWLATRKENLSSEEMVQRLMERKRK